MAATPAPTDLVTLKALKGWLNTSGQAYPGTSDELLARLITAASRFVASYLQRNIQPKQYADVYNGTGQDQLFLRNRPVISVSSVVIGGTVTVPPSTPAPLGYGFVSDDTSVYMVGGAGCFPRGYQNVAVTYRAGLQTTNPITVPATGGAFSVSGLTPPWNSDVGVAYTNGTALVRVASAPAAGQYSVSYAEDGTAQYMFAEADGDAAVVVTYGYTPEDVYHATLEIIGERFKVRGRIGEKSQGLHQQPTTFDVGDMNATVKAMLQPYRNVVPVQ